MTISVSAWPFGFQIFDNNGNPVSGALVNAYVAGSSVTRQNTYSDSGSSPTANANPVVADGYGRVSIFLDNTLTYHFIVTDPTGATTYLNEDNVVPSVLPLLEGSSGATYIGFEQIGSSVLRNVNVKLNETITPQDFNASLVSGGDATSAINNALTYLNSVGGGNLYFTPGWTYVVNSQITIPGSNICLMSEGGYSTIQAAPNTTFNAVIYATSQSYISLRNLIVDANQSNRLSGQNTQYLAIKLVSCTSPEVERCIVMNALGYNSISGVGCAFGGTTVNGVINRCQAINCGTSGAPSDGFYVSGNNNLILGSFANNCYDTGFVIEDSNRSGISNCISQNCGAVAAITNATNSNVYDNYMSNVVGYEWSSSVVGGLEIGNPVSSTTGNLINTKLENVTMRAAVGLGPAIQIRQTGSAITQTITLTDVTIEGGSSTNQGLLIEAVDVHINNINISGTQGECIESLPGASNIYINGGKVVEGGTSYSVVFQSSNNYIKDLNLDGGGVTSYGIYFIGSLTNCVVQFVEGNNYNDAIVGSDSGTVPDVINRYSTGISFRKDAGIILTPISSGDIAQFNGRVGGTTGLCTGNSVTAAGVATVTNAFIIYDMDGNVLGYVPIYATHS